MSTIHIAKFQGDPARLEAVIRAHTGDFEAIAEYARSIGCLHHRFAAHGHELVLIDEWQDIKAAVTKFWFLPPAVALMQEAGAQPIVEGAHYHPIEDPTEF